MTSATSSNLAGAWGGDPARKQASIATARAALAASSSAMCIPKLILGASGQSSVASNVYCAAFSTADPAELEARAGVSADTLLLASAALFVCEHWDRGGDGTQRSQGLVGGAKDAPIAALEAIRVGADPLALARCYVVDLLGRLAPLVGPAGQGLTSDQQGLVRRLAALHESDGTDPATFRAFRRAATSATDTAAGDLECTVLRFVESVAWPLASFSEELPEFIKRVHLELRWQLARDRLPPTERATVDAVAALYRAANERLKANPALDPAAELKSIETTPEYAAEDDPAFQAQLDHYRFVAAEAYAPFAVDLLIGAFRRA